MHDPGLCYRRGFPVGGEDSEHIEPLFNLWGKLVSSQDKVRAKIVRVWGTLSADPPLSSFAADGPADLERLPLRSTAVISLVERQK
jgi:hypothetical protein